MTNEYTECVKQCLREALVKCKVYHMPDADLINLQAKVWADDFQELGHSIERVQEAFKVWCRRPTAEYPAYGHILGVIADFGPTQEQIDERRYRGLKLKQTCSSWFLSGPEERFLSEYEELNPQRITGGSEQLRGSGFKRLRIGLMGE